MSYKSTHTGAQIDAGVAAALSPDATPSTSSTALITSGAVAAGLADKASNADVALKAPIASPALTGTPTAPTPTAGDDSNKIATTAFVGGEIATESAATEQKILALYPTDSISNQPVASFSDGADGIPVKALTVNITPVQSGSGDPSPTNVRPISGWTGANIFDNIFNVNGNLRPVVSINNDIYDYSDKTTVSGASITMDAYSQTGASRRILLGYVKAGITYSFKLNSSTTWYVSVYDGLIVPNGEIPNLITWTTSQESSVRTATLTPNQNGFAYFCFGGGVSLNAATVTDILMEIADSEISIPFPTPPGTVYGGTLTDNGDGTWTLNVTTAIIDLGGRSWTRAADAVGGHTFWATIPNAKRRSGSGYNSCWCAIYKGVVKSAGALGEFQMTQGGDYFTNSGNIAIKNETYTSAADFKTAMDGIMLVYTLATPQTYTLTAESVRTLLGNNNIFADCGDVNTLTYRADVGLYIDKKLAEA